MAIFFFHFVAYISYVKMNGNYYWKIQRTILTKLRMNCSSFCDDVGGVYVIFCLALFYDVYDCDENYCVYFCVGFYFVTASFCLNDGAFALLRPFDGRYLKNRYLSDNFYQYHYFELSALLF